MRAGVISDIHGSWRRLQKAVRAMGPVDLMLLAGDGVREMSLWQRKHPFVQIRMVAGNCDFAVDCPSEQVFFLDGYKTLLTHGHLQSVKTGLNGLTARARRTGAALVVYGHTHEPDIIVMDGVRYFNPGSIYGNRPAGGASFGLIEIDGEGLKTEIIYI